MGWVSQNVVLIDFDGVQSVIGTLFDISERKRIEEKLFAEKEQLSVTMASIGDGVVSTDVNGLIVTINAQAIRLAESSYGDAVGRHLDDIFTFAHETVESPPGGFVRFMMRQHGIKSHVMPCLLKLRSGGERAIELSVAPVKSRAEDVIGMVVVLRDMTERRSMEAELFKARKLESLGVLAGGIAHDFNNMLTGIITNLFMAKIRIKNDPETSQLLAEAEKSSFRASKLVKQLFTFSKGGAPVKEVVALKEVIEDAVGFCLSGSNVSYKLDIPAELKPVEVDRGQIDQVLNNLIINADQAMPGGGTLLVGAENVKIEAPMAPLMVSGIMLGAGDYVRIIVRDEGFGIAKENIDKIFDPYFTTKQMGNGLGLTIAYSIVKNHRGAIAVESVVDCGTTVSVYLPVAKLDKISPAKEKQHRTHVPKSQQKILVMDDDVAVRSVVLQLLKNTGYHAVCATTGQEAIDMYSESMKQGQKFDVVVMDLTIPGGMGGKEAVTKLLEVDPQARVLVSSGYSNDPVMAEFDKYGFCGVITKPFIVDEFLEAIQKALLVERC
jgi:two-component system cell cycle sensor histidine kinase/response regulator CckA